MRYNIVSLITLVLVALSIERTTAQVEQEQQLPVIQKKHEFSIQNGLGVSTFNYSLSEGNRSAEFGNTVGVGYKYFFSEKFSFQSGIELAFYNSKSSINTLSDNYLTKDSEGDNIRFSYSFNNYTEKQRGMFLTIPIMGQYQIPVFKKHKFYGGLGVRVGIPINARYESSGSSLTTSAFYVDYGWEAHPSQSQGIGTFEQKPVKEDIHFKTALMLAAEAGLKWDMNSIYKGLSVYTGIYCDYGLNDIRKNTDNTFLVYNSSNPSNFIHNSALSSNYKGKNFTDKVSPMAIGFKIGIAIQIP